MQEHVLGWILAGCQTVHTAARRDWLPSVCCEGWWVCFVPVLLLASVG